MTAQIIEMPIVTKLECPKCGAAGQGTCRCGVPYVPAGQRAAEAVKASPEKSNVVIAEEIGVDEGTVRRARKATSEYSEVEEKRVGKDGKMRRMPIRKPPLPETEERTSKIIAYYDAGLTMPEIAVEVGCGKRTVRHTIDEEIIRRNAEPKIDPTTLSLSAQQRLDIAIKQHKQKLDLEFRQRVREGIEEAINDTVLPSYLKDIKEAREVIESRKGVMTKAEFTYILSCLHPDRVNDETLKIRYTKAFNIFKAHELVLVKKKELPSEFTPLPSTYKEMMELKQKVAEERKRKRDARRDTPNIRV